MSNDSNSNYVPYTTKEESKTRERIAELMLEDYELVIFYLLRKLDIDADTDLNEINVVMKNGLDTYDFKIKKPVAGKNGSRVHKIEYLSEI